MTDVKKLLTSGAFYFAWSVHGNPIDLTLCAQKAARATEGATDNRQVIIRVVKTSKIYPTLPTL